jgi:AcrR family transcriptional regulator
MTIGFMSSLLFVRNTFFAYDVRIAYWYAVRMSKPDLPIWLRPEPGERRPRFTRDSIAAAALAIADSAGFEAVSMREVASRLGAGTMTLYHYVRTKDELVALMDDALMAEVLVPDSELPRGWRAQLSAIARRTRAIYEHHPWALLAMRGAPPGPNGMRHFEQCLAALAETGLDAAGKLELLGLIDDFVFGHALRAGEQRMYGSEQASAVGFRLFAEREIATGAYPETARVFAGLGKRQDVFHGGEARFERGLQALLDAAESGIAGARAKKRAAVGGKRKAPKAR